MLRRLVKSPFFRLPVGLLLVLSSAAEMSQALPGTLPAGKTHAVLLWGILHLMVSFGMVLEGVKKVGDVRVVGKYLQPLSKITHANSFALVIGVLLVGGSLVDLVVEATEFPTLSSAHGLLVYAGFHLILTISHLFKGAREMATVNPSRWEKLAKLMERPMVEVTAALALSASSLIEIWSGTEGTVEWSAAHGLTAFAVATILESIVLSVSDLEEVQEQHYQT